MRSPRRLLAALACSAACGGSFAACSLTTSLDGLTGGGAGDAGGDAASDARASDDGATGDATSGDDGAAQGDAGAGPTSLWVMGGITDTSPATAQMMRADLRADGTVGAWVASTPLPAPLYLGAAVVFGDTLAVLGGEETSGATATTRTTTFVPAGLDPWALGTDFGTPRFRHGAAIVGGHVYVVGGRDAGNDSITDVQAAPLTPTGIGTWTSATPLPSPVAHHVTVAIGDWVYAIGGEAAGAYLDTAYDAHVAADGSLTWGTTTSLPRATDQGCGVAHGGRVYVVGGLANSSGWDRVEVAVAASDGTLGAWTATTPLPSGRFLHRCVATPTTLYVIGGVAETGGARLADVLGASFHADGTLGPWVSMTPLPSARDSVMVVAH